MSRARSVLAAVVAACAGAACGGSADVTGVAATADRGWFAAWTTAHTGAVTAPLADQSLRQLLQLSAGGDQLRVRVRNRFGAGPVTIGRAAVGLPGEGAALKPGTNKAVTFGGGPGVTVAAGEDALSDPVAFVSVAQQTIAVSLYLPGSATPSQDGNAYMPSFTTAAGAGDHVMDDDGAAYASASTAMVLVDAVLVHGATLAGTIIGVGGSTTDGVGSDGRTLDATPSPTAAATEQPDCQPCRWTDFLARRIEAELPEGLRRAVGNAGVLGDTTPDVLARFDADVLTHAGLTHVILYSGANDLGVGTGDDAATIIGNIRSAIDRSHAAGARIVVATINPRAAYTAGQNAQRHEVNAWIRAGGGCGGACDGVADFDAVLAWPENPDAMDPKYDSGDDIHPTAAGYQAMAAAIDLALFQD